VRISAKADYALRAMIELARAEEDKPVKGELLARAQDIPLKFLENILGDLRHQGLVRSQRGADGGYLLAKPAWAITVADIVRGVEGPLAHVRGQKPEDVVYPDSAMALQRVWIAVRGAMRSVVERTTLADLATGKLPEHVDTLADDPDSWLTR
jgi:Rrf2 family protein